MKTKFLRLTFGALAAIPALTYAAAPEWVLMSRHGDCFEIARVLSRRFDGLPAINGPMQFVSEMGRLSLSVKVTEAPDGDRDLVLVDVPAREMTLIFARRTRCESTSRPSR